MKKFLTLALTAVMALSLLTACGSKNDNSADTNTDGSNTETTLSGTVSTDGSTSMEKVINSLGESFMAMNKDVKFTYNPTGSGSGIQAVSEGRCDIGLSSRALKDDEKASGLVETVVALDGIAIVVNPENPVSDLDIDTIAKIYTGEITNWKDVGGNDAEIVLIGREAGSGTRDGFESITDTKDACQYRQELTSTGRVPDPRRHRLCLPLRGRRQRQGADSRRCGSHGGDRQGRQLCGSASVRARHEGGHRAFPRGTGLLRLRAVR